MLLIFIHNRLATGDKLFDRFLNEYPINKYCDRCIKYLKKRLGVPAHRFFFELKEYNDSNMKVTEANFHHMTYTDVLEHVGIELIEDTIQIGDSKNRFRDSYHQYLKSYIFPTDIDVEQIELESIGIFDNPTTMLKTLSGGYSRNLINCFNAMPQSGIAA